MSDLDYLNTKDKVLVVGGTSGIGLATARKFIEKGMDVLVMSKSQSSVDNALAELGEHSSGIVLDVTKDDDVESIFSNLGHFKHVVISTAATPLPIGNIANIENHIAYNAMNTKFWGAYRIAKAVKIVPKGTLTFISGVLSDRPTKTTSLIAAINSAIEGLSKGLALERAPIRVNTVSPGLLSNASMLKNTPKDECELIASKLPLGKIGTPEAVANTILFITQNDHITGSTIVVDNGGSLV